MDIISCIEEIILTHSICKKYFDCDGCTYQQHCAEVFGKKCPVIEIEELSSQCKAFNDFARANMKGNI